MKRDSLVQFVFKSVCFWENKICSSKIHLFSILNTKQTNDGIFSNKAGEKQGFSDFKGSSIRYGLVRYMGINFIDAFEITQPL